MSFEGTGGCFSVDDLKVALTRRRHDTARP